MASNRATAWGMNVVITGVGVSREWYGKNGLTYDKRHSGRV